MGGVTMGVTAVPMRDGVRLATGLHLAEQDGRWPASLLRTGVRQTGVGGPARGPTLERSGQPRDLRLRNGRRCWRSRGPRFLLREVKVHDR